jgi:hypothetical protein
MKKFKTNNIEEVKERPEVLMERLLNIAITKNILTESKRDNKIEKVELHQETDTQVMMKDDLSINLNVIINKKYNPYFIFKLYYIIFKCYSNYFSSNERRTFC